MRAGCDKMDDAEIRQLNEKSRGRQTNADDSRPPLCDFCLQQARHSWHALLAWHHLRGYRGREVTPGRG
jgi:hypothetical protein